MIKDFFDGMILREDQFLVVSFTKLISTTGNQYGNITLQDSTGTIEGKKWSLDDEDLYIFQPGKIVSLNGEVLNYKGNLQVKIFSAREIDKKHVDLSKFLIQSNYSLNDLKNRYISLIAQITDDEILSVVETIFEKYNDEIFSFPAAKRNHHNYLRGLITHSLSMAEIALYIAKQYKNVDINMVIGGALLHDVGKIIELSGPEVTTYTTEGMLLGHISLGYYIVRETCTKLNISKEKATLLQHLILSHHGKFEYGSPVLPTTKEAVLLAMVDDLDAKMELCDNVLENVSEGEFSGRVFAFNDRSIYKPKK